MSRIAFYAPIKPPDHPIASGDRLIAQNLIQALQNGGHEVELASRFIAYSKRDADEILKERKRQAQAHALSLIASLAESKPNLWITYHPYCKAPDWIGPIVCEKLNIPYVTIEAARTGQGFENGGDRWAHWRSEAQEGLKQADLHLAFKPQDKDYLHSLPGMDVPVEMIKPFAEIIDPSTVTPQKLQSHWRPKTPVLIAVGMMRPGKKVENYMQLAHALSPLKALHWNLVVIGDGPEREHITKYFSEFDDARLHFTGAIDHDQVLSYMRASDLFVWPGWKEPIGMVYLEAQMMGLPVIAQDSMGVSLTVSHGFSGLLSDEGVINGFSENLSQAISHPALRDDLSKNAVRNVSENHSMKTASKKLNDVLNSLLR